MHAQHECSAKAARGLQPMLDGGETVEGMDLVEQIPHPQIACAGHPHQRVDGQIHPQCEQGPVEGKVGVGRGDEQDRTRHGIFLHPAPDREGRRPARNRIGQKADGLRIGVEDGPDGFGHARSFHRRQRPRDGVGQPAVDRLEVGFHQMMGDRAVGGFTAGRQLDAHFHEERARCHRPEGFGIAAIAGDQRGGGRNVVGVVLAIVENRPRRTALIHRIEDVIAAFLVEGLHEGAGQVEHHTPLTALACFGNKVAQLGGFARTGGPDQHGVGLFEPPGIGDPSHGVGHMQTKGHALGDWQFSHLGKVHGRMALGQFLRELCVVVGADFADQHIGADHHSAALVPLLQDIDADLLGKFDEPLRQGAGEQGRTAQRHEDAPDKLRPSISHIGIGLYVADLHGNQRAIGECEIDHVAGVEVDKAPEPRKEVHLDELNFMLLHHDGQQQGQQNDEAGGPRERGPAQAFHHHHIAQPDKLRATGESAHIADDLAARGLVLHGDRSPVEADVVLTLHGIFSHERWPCRAGGQLLPEPPSGPTYRAPGW